MARASRPKQVGALRHGEKRVNIPTAEMQSFFQREEDHSPLPPKQYERRLPLAEGERRERDPDRDPQLLWNGMRITLTEAQRGQLAEIGEIEIGEAQLVWRGKDPQRRTGGPQVDFSQIAIEYLKSAGHRQGAVIPPHRQVKGCEFLVGAGQPRSAADRL